MKTLLTVVAAALVALSFAMPVLGQNDDLETRVLRLIADGEALIAAGQDDEGLALIHEANDLTFDVEGMSLVVQFLPNLAMARDALRLRQSSEAKRFGQAIAAGLTEIDDGTHIYQLEGRAILGEALAQLGEDVNAEAVLRGVLRDSADRNDAAKFYDVALYHLALVATKQSSTDAQELRAMATRELRGSEWISAHDFAYMRSVDMLELRSTDMPAADILAAYRRFLIYIRGTDIAADELAIHERNIALYLLEARQIEEATVVLRKTRLFLTEQRDFTIDYVHNAQQLGIALVIAGELVEAEEILLDAVSVTKNNKDPDLDLLAVLYRDLGYIAGQRDDHFKSQLYYRDAYAAARSAHGPTHPDVIDMRKNIDTEAAGFSALPFARDFSASGEGVEYTPYNDARRVVELFLAGTYLDGEAITSVFDGADDEQIAAHSLNLGVHNALLGHLDLALTNIENARIFADSMNGSTLSANSPYFDIAEITALVWGTSLRPDDADPAIERLQTRSDLTYSQTSVFLALQAMRHTQEAHEAETISFLRQWMAHYDLDAPKNFWDVFASLSIVEIAYAQLPIKEADILSAQALKDMDELGDLVLARDYIELVRFMNGENAVVNSDSLIELGVLIKHLSTLVPNNHVLQTAARWSYTIALWNQGEYEQAYEILAETVEFLKLDPYHRLDTEAFLTSELARLLALTGNTALARALSQEAYEMLDADVHRTDLYMSVTTNFIYSLYGNADIAQAEQISRDLIETDLFATRAPASSKTNTYLVFAWVLESKESFEEAAIQYEKALDLVPLLINYRDTEWSRILFSKARNDSFRGNLQSAFETMHQSNNIYQKQRADLAAGQVTGTVTAMEEDLWRVKTEADLGWAYAQSLRAGE